MSIIPYEYFVNNETFNVFTDASIIHRKVNINGDTYTYYFGSPGYDIYIGNNKILGYHNVLPICTNNQSEISAIRYGVDRALDLATLYNIKKINIFSDSKICIYGLREWIFSWMNNIRNGTLYNSSGKEVANQFEFLAIVHMILLYNRPVQFYHIRGHMNINSFKDRKKFNESFMKENYTSDHLDERLIDFFISANDIVDNVTRYELQGIQESTKLYYDNMLRSRYQYKNLEKVFTYNDYLGSIDLDRYKKLIGGNLL